MRAMTAHIRGHADKWNTERPGDKVIRNAIRDVADDLDEIADRAEQTDE